MLSSCQSPSRSEQAGFSLLEVLVTIIVLAFGLLGLAGLQMRVQVAEMESYQRAQALVLMNDMVERITANRANAAAYPSEDVWGTGNTTYASTSCSSLAVGTVARDRCEWNRLLQGSTELSSSSLEVGAMVGARGCISEIQTQDAATGICLPGIYEVAVAWQGLAATGVPANTCGKDQYGTDDATRRVVSMRITVGLPGCS